MTTIDGRRIVGTAAVVCLILLLGITTLCVGPAAPLCWAANAQTALISQPWLPPTNISRSPEADSEAPALVVNDGGAHLVWGEESDIYHSYLDGKTWTTPSKVHTGEQPSLAIGSGATIHLVFINEFGGAYDVYYVQWDGTGWTPPRPVSDTGSLPDSPDVAADDDGRLHVVWTEDGQIYHAESSDGLLWAYAAIADGTAPTISTGEQSSVHAAWQAEATSGYYEVYCSELGGGSWSPPANVSNSANRDSTAPDLATAADGTPHLAWQEIVSATAQVHYSRGRAWTEPISLSNNDDGAYLPALAVDAWGRRHAAWENIDLLSYRIRYTYAAGADSAWKVPGTLAQGASPSQILEDVSLYAGPDGVVHAAWVKGESGKGEIFHAQQHVHRIYLPVMLRQTGI